MCIGVFILVWVGKYFMNSKLMIYNNIDDIENDLFGMVVRGFIGGICSWLYYGLLLKYLDFCCLVYLWCKDYWFKVFGVL